MAQNRINVFVPPISNFPEFRLGGYSLKDRVQVLPKGPGRMSRSTEPREERELQYLYVIDSQGRLLEHMRYSGDYRVALREAFAENSSPPAAPNTQSKPNLNREPSGSNAVLPLSQFYSQQSQ